MIEVAMDVHVRNSFVHATDGKGQVVVKGRVGNTLMELDSARGEQNDPPETRVERGVGGEARPDGV
jgi:hypothetical protein